MNIEKAKRENANVLEAEQLLSTADKRSMSVTGYKNYIQIKHDIRMKPLTEFYGNMKWRKFNFRVSSYKNKSLDLFIMKIGNLIMNSNHHHHHHPHPHHHLYHNHN